jgi:hypothetical protein
LRGLCHQVQGSPGSDAVLQRSGIGIKHVSGYSFDGTHYTANTLGTYEREAEPLHQLIAILPIHIRLQMLSKTAALTLLTVPHSSQIIQRLGQPWCDANELDEDIPMTPYPTPSTPITRLASLVPQEARRPTSYRLDQWARLPPRSDRLRGSERSMQSRTVKTGNF